VRTYVIGFEFEELTDSFTTGRCVEKYFVYFAKVYVCVCVCVCVCVYVYIKCRCVLT